jgi:hypothetical protein
MKCFLTIRRCKKTQAAIILSMFMIPYLFYFYFIFCFIHYNFLSFFGYLQVKSNGKQSRMSLTEDGIFHTALVHLTGNT